MLIGCWLGNIVSVWVGNWDWSSAGISLCDMDGITLGLRVWSLLETILGLSVWEYNGEDEIWVGGA